MEFLDRKYGPLRGRAWGLIVNMVSNALALYGLARVLSEGEGYGVLLTGAVLTMVTILVVACPSE